MSRHSRKTYFWVWGLLALFTALEISVANPSLHLGRTQVALGLTSLAVAKAALVAYYFMHLGQERRALKLTVALPFLAPALYAAVLISEAAWRLSK